MRVLYGTINGFKLQWIHIVSHRWPNPLHWNAKSRSIFDVWWLCTLQNAHIIHWSQLAEILQTTSLGQFPSFVVNLKFCWMPFALNAIFPLSTKNAFYSTSCHQFQWIRFFIAVHHHHYHYHRDSANLIWSNWHVLQTMYLVFVL